MKRHTPEIAVIGAAGVVGAIIGLVAWTLRSITRGVRLPAGEPFNERHTYGRRSLYD